MTEFTVGYSVNGKQLLTVQIFAKCADAAKQIVLATVGKVKYIEVK